MAIEEWEEQEIFALSQMHTLRHRISAEEQVDAVPKLWFEKSWGLFLRRRTHSMPSLSTEIIATRFQTDLPADRPRLP